MSDIHRHSRTQSLSPSISESLDKSGNFEFEFTEDIEEKVRFGDDDSEDSKSKKPSEVAYEDITNTPSTTPIAIQSPSLSYTPSNADSTSTSLFGSIYSLGEAMLSFIRGPVETDSNDNLVSSTSEYRRKKSKSFSFSSPKPPNSSSLAASENEDNDSDFFSDSSDAPDFDLKDTETEVDNNKLTRQHSSRGSISVAEPGRGKIVFSNVDPFCKLIARDFSKDEHILTVTNISTIQSQIPARWNVYTDWILVYSTSGNGFSLTTLYHQLKSFKGPLIIALKDEYGAIFGAFLNQSIHPRQGHYGNGECFLWTIKENNDNNPVYTKYPSTGKNNYFIMSESNYLAIGCGAGKFGLWLEKELFKGISEPVPTFDNENLATNQNFECIAIEIWGLDLTD